VLAAVDVEGEVDTYRYGLVLTFTSGPRGEEMLDRHPDRVLARIAGARGGTLHEVIEADAARVLMRMLTDGTRLPGRDGIFDAASQGPAVLADYEPYTLMPTTLGQTVITCGAAAELKIRRRLLLGRSHEQLLLGALAQNLEVELPVAYAHLDLLTPDSRRWPFVLLRSRVPFTDDGWDRSRQIALRWIAEPHPMADRPDPFAWLREGRDAPRLDSEPLHDVERMARVMGRRVAATHMAIASSTAAAAGQTPAGDDTSASKDREMAEAALAALADLPAHARSRWTTLMDSPAGHRILASRQVLGALARWRWSDGELSPVDPDDSTPGTRGTTADYGERDIAALSADLAYAVLTALEQAGHRDPQDPVARAWWSIGTWALVRGWQEELAAAGTTTVSVPELIEGLRVGLLWRLLVDAVSAREARRRLARAVLTDLAARPVGDQ
jgi:hypothetical protein